MINRQGETFKKMLLDFAEGYRDRAVAANHPQADLFSQVVARINETSDMRWFYDHIRRGAQPTMNEIAKMIKEGK